MNIYFSGIGGVGIGPLAEIAHDAGHTVAGSDMSEGLITQQLAQKGITFSAQQDGSYLEKVHAAAPIDWFVYTSALPADHPELVRAKSLGIRTGKRDEFLAEFLKEHKLKMIAIAGTHGKTGTTGLAVWLFQQLGIPVSYSVGTTLSFGPSGAYVAGSEYFIYECDEFDRNFLHFHPEFSLITSVDYDHPDTYPTETDYKQAFKQYIAQSAHTLMWHTDQTYIGNEPSPAVTVLPEETSLQAGEVQLPGAHIRRNATLVWELAAVLGVASKEQVLEIFNRFPGADRRFEKIAPNLYSDYGHHPKEIAATLQLAREIAPHVTLVYQPHQNQRQHEIIDQYTDELFKDADAIFWLPTHLARENPAQPVLTPQELTEKLGRQGSIQYFTLEDDALVEAINKARSEGSLVLCMGAGSIDSWVRAYAKENIAY